MYNKNSKVDSLNQDWGAGGGIFDRVKDYHFYKALFDRISNNLFFPKIFSRNNIFGGVTARLVFTEEGNCDFKQTRINGSDKHLKIFILHVLKSTCRENFKKFLGDRKLTIADLSFQFQTSEGDAELDSQSKEFIVGNTLHFYRSVRESIAEWHFGPFTGLFPLPIVNIDFDRLQEAWSQYVGNEDPRKDLKIESQIHAKETSEVDID